MVGIYYYNRGLPLTHCRFNQGVKENAMNFPKLMVICGVLCRHIGNGMYIPVREDD